MKPSSGAARGWLVHQTPVRLYDATIFVVDFSYRAHLAGFRAGVTHDIVIAHESVGNFNETWIIYAGRFKAKFPELGENTSPWAWRALLSQTAETPWTSSADCGHYAVLPRAGSSPPVTTNPSP